MQAHRRFRARVGGQCNGWDIDITGLRVREAVIGQAEGMAGGRRRHCWALCGGGLQSHGQVNIVDVYRVQSGGGRRRGCWSVANKAGDGCVPLAEDFFGGRLVADLLSMLDGLRKLEWSDAGWLRAGSNDGQMIALQGSCT